MLNLLNRLGLFLTPSRGLFLPEDEDGSKTDETNGDNAADYTADDSSGVGPFAVIVATAASCSGRSCFGGRSARSSGGWRRRDSTVATVFLKGECRPERLTEIDILPGIREGHGHLREGTGRITVPIPHAVVVRISAAICVGGIRTDA